MSNTILFSKEGRHQLKIGVDAVGDAVKVTAGAGGRNVIIQDPSSHYPRITKDGWTVSKSINLEDNIQQMGVAMMHQVAYQTVMVAGDGTSASTVLAQAIVHEGFKAIDNGAKPVDVWRGINKAVLDCTNTLKDLAKKVETDEDLLNISTISCNGDRELGAIVADAVKKTGTEGEIKVEMSKDDTTYVEMTEGYKIDVGYEHFLMVNNAEKMQCEMNDCYILMYDKTISTMRELVPILTELGKLQKPLLIIAQDVNGEAFETITANCQQGLLRGKICVVRAPSHGEEQTEIMEDIAAATGGEYIGRLKGDTLETTTVAKLGFAKRVVVKQSSCVIIGAQGSEERVEERCESIRQWMKEHPSEPVQNTLKKRLAKLKNKSAILYVGALSETESKEKADRIDDAVRATNAAIEEGYVAGGGTTYLVCCNKLNLDNAKNDGELEGYKIISKALLAPFINILANAGIEIEKAYDINDYGMGYDAHTGDFVNLFDKGIIDPKKVTRVALENAASIAGIFLTTECVISQNQEKK